MISRVGQTPRLPTNAQPLTGIDLHSIPMYRTVAINSDTGLVVGTYDSRDELAKEFSTSTGLKKDSLLRKIRQYTNTDHAILLKVLSLGTTINVLFAKNPEMSGAHGTKQQVELLNVATGVKTVYKSFAEANEAIGRPRLDPLIRHASKNGHSVLGKYRIRKLPN